MRTFWSDCRERLDSRSEARAARWSMKTAPPLHVRPCPRMTAARHNALSSRDAGCVIPPQMTVKTQTDAVAGPEPRDHHRCALLHSPFSPVWRRPACDRESASPSRHDGGLLDSVTATASGQGTGSASLSPI